MTSDVLELPVELCSGHGEVQRVERVFAHLVVPEDHDTGLLAAPQPPAGQPRSFPE